MCVPSTLLFCTCRPQTTKGKKSNQRPNAAKQPSGIASSAVIVDSTETVTNTMAETPVDSAASQIGYSAPHSYLFHIECLK